MSDLLGVNRGSVGLPESRAETPVRPLIHARSSTESAIRTALLAVSNRADGVILLNVVGAITFINEAALAILATRDGLARAGGGVVAYRPPESRRLAHLLRGALPGPGFAGGPAAAEMLVSRRTSGRPYLVRIVPVPPVDPLFAARETACIMLVRDLNRDALSPGTLSRLFGLTRREADIASALVRRGNLRHAARDAAMATNTARNHLRSIFLKTCVNSQVALVGLLAGLA